MDIYSTEIALAFSAVKSCRIGIFSAQHARARLSVASELVRYSRALRTITFICTTSEMPLYMIFNKLGMSLLVIVSLVGI